MNMMEIWLGSNWVCARNGPWRFPGKFLSSNLVGQCSGGFGWKVSDGPQIVNIDGLVVGKWDGEELGV